jgi:hypothetical protein
MYIIHLESYPLSIDTLSRRKRTSKTLLTSYNHPPHKKGGGEGGGGKLNFFSCFSFWPCCFSFSFSLSKPLNPSFPITNVIASRIKIMNQKRSRKLPPPPPFFSLFLCSVRTTMESNATEGSVGLGCAGIIHAWHRPYQAGV